ncbi:MAG: hypothetical protein LUE93_02260 [Bacteroides sp.]|nr:hypothetical protein [Bacteroides sp.]
MSTFYNYFQCRLAPCPQEAPLAPQEEPMLTESILCDFYRELYKRTFPLKEGEEVTDITQLEELLANALDSYNLFASWGVNGIL